MQENSMPIITIPLQPDTAGGRGQIAERFG
jgi:hypothetical protein